MDEIAQKWEHLTDIQRASVIELMAGRHHGNTFSALMNNFQQARNATETAMNSEGSAWREQQHYMKGIQFSLDRMRATFQEFSEVSIGSDFIKGAVDGAQSLLEILTKIVDSAGMLPLVLGGIGIARGIGRLGSSAMQGMIDNQMSRFGLHAPGEDPLAGFANWDTTGDVKKINLLTRAKEGAAKAGTKLGVTLKSIGSGLWAIGKAMLPLLLIAGAIKLVTWAHGKMVEAQTKTTRGFETMLDSAERYSSAKSEVESLRSELEEVSSRIDELNGKPSLTIIEQAELNKLARTSDELENQLAIAERIAEVERKGTISSFERNANSTFSNRELREMAEDGGFTTTLGINSLSQEERKALYNRAEAGDSEAREQIRSSNVTATDALKQASSEYRDAKTAFEEAQRNFAEDDSKANKRVYEEASERFENAETQLNFTRNFVNEIFKTLSDVGNLEGDALVAFNAMGEAITDSLNVDLTAAEISAKNLERFFNSSSNRHIIDTLREMAKEAENGLDIDAVMRLNIDWESHGIDISDLVQHVNDELNNVNIDINDGSAFLDLLDNTGTHYGMFLRDYANMIKEAELTVADIHKGLSEGTLFKETPMIKEFFDILEKLGLSTEESIEFMVKLGFVTTGTPDEDISKMLVGIEGATNRVKNAIQATSSAMSALNNQSAGRSLSIDTFNSLQEQYGNIHTAVEYVNGSMQLNRERTLELVKARNQEETAMVKVNKAQAQSRYARNATEIRRLRNELRGLNNEHQILAGQARIDYLVNAQSDILAEIAGYNLLIASMDEATNSYHNWLAAKGQSLGVSEKLSEAIDAFSVLRNLWTEGHEAFGRIGNDKVLAAVDFMLPDHIDHADRQALNAYLDSISHFFRFDESGNKIGMDIYNFMRSAEVAGLVQEIDGDFVINPNVKMQDFADKLDIPLSLVRAFFAEMREFGGDFSWFDESIKSLGDLEVAAHQAIDTLSEMTEVDIDFRFDYSEFGEAKYQIAQMNADLKEMTTGRDLMIKAEADPSAIEAMNTVILRTIVNRQLLERPLFMSVDTSMLDEDVANSVALMQQLYSLVEQYDQQVAIGGDTTRLEAAIEDVFSLIQEDRSDVRLGFEAEGIESVESIIGLMKSIEDIDTLVKFGIDIDAVTEYDPQDLTASVIFTTEHSAVDAFMSRNFDIEATVYHTHIETNSPPSATSSRGSGGRPRVNGTANLRGTAYANGNWGTERSERPLVGELGQELVVVGSRWYTVGDRGAEFTNIPKGAIIFNHKQTEEIFRNGFVSSGGGRGKSYASGNAYAQGTAHVRGGISISNAQNSSGQSSFTSTVGQSQQAINSANNATKAVEAAHHSAGDALKALAEYFDFIEIRLKVLERATRRAERLIKNAISLAQAQEKTSTTLAKVQAQIQAAREAYERYTAHSQW